MHVNINSELGELEGAVVHTPGLEVEEMTPKTAKRALYSDILNLSVARSEYIQLKGVLSGICQCLEVTDLLADILQEKTIRNSLVQDICKREEATELISELNELSAPELARQLIQGVPIKRNTLSRYLSQERFSLWPLHNFLFTRDAAMVWREQVIIGNMANRIRKREARIMEAVFTHHPLLKTGILRAGDHEDTRRSRPLTIEGGDFLVAREDLLLIGTGNRTSTRGIDFILEQVKNRKEGIQHILVQELPEHPESFIHLDMVFTLLDRDTCMVYEPLIMHTNRFHTLHVQIEHGEVSRITEEENLPKALKKLGMDLKPVFCGGHRDPWIQEREQWHSGANFFAVAPGQIIGYERNVHTVEELSNNGFEVIRAEEIINGKKEIPAKQKCVITIAG
ncbi:MAG: arginine deiminase family protein, partial [Mangrovibacterium sp.]